MSITIHHCKEAGAVSADIHLYCGRGENNVKGLVNVRMGNPFIMKKWDLGERDRVCDAYERHLQSLPATANEWRVIERMKQRLSEGKTIALYCYCAPQRCHCESIKRLAMA